MSKKSTEISRRIESFRGGQYDPHYAGYFACFNQAEFYTAHDVLEELWLSTRATPDNLFYKGLIQLAGAFVHLQKNRLKPAVALFNLAERNLKLFVPYRQGLDVAGVLSLISEWRGLVENGNFESNPLNTVANPRLELNTGAGPSVSGGRGS